MKHAASRELYAYWEERRGRRAAPERAEIEPGAIRGALSDAFILSLDAARGHPLRLAGTRVCALFDRELRGEPFLRLWAADSRTIIAGLLAILGDGTIGTVAGATGRNRAGHVLDLELLPLPLDVPRPSFARAIGVLVPPSSAMAGTSPLGRHARQPPPRRAALEKRLLPRLLVPRAAVVSLSTMAAVPSGSFAGATSVGVNAG